MSAWFFFPQWKQLLRCLVGQTGSSFLPPSAGSFQGYICLTEKERERETRLAQTAAAANRTALSLFLSLFLPPFFMHLTETKAKKKDTHPPLSKRDSLFWKRRKSKKFIVLLDGKIFRHLCRHTHSTVDSQARVRLIKLTKKKDKAQ